MKTNKIQNNNDEENIEKVYEPETVIKLLNYIESAMDSWLKNERYNFIAIDEHTVDENGYLYLNICKNNVEIMRKIVKSYYISDDGTVTSKGNNEK
jgi:hypothetical protein